MEALENDPYTAALEAWGRTLPRPRAILVASAHWAAPGPLRVTAAATPETIHDFFGFPDELHAVEYPAPGDPGLAADIVARLKAAGLPAAADPHRGLDHGTWVPLRRVRPGADVPVIQISVPVPSDPSLLLRAGAALAPLRRDGILVLGSGNVTHNLRRAVFGAKDAPVQDWARAFDAWVWERLQAGRMADLEDYRRSAPHADAAVPDPDHFDPLFFIAAAADGDLPTPLYEGFHFGNLSMRSWTAGRPPTDAI